MIQKIQKITKQNSNQLYILTKIRTQHIKTLTQNEKQELIQ